MAGNERQPRQPALNAPALANASGARQSDVDVGEVLYRGARKPRLTLNIDGSVTASLQEFQSWFGPGTGLEPVAPPSVAGRQLDYPFGFNLRITPKDDQQQGGLSFSAMRALADNYDLLRALIERQKDKLCSFKWSIKPRDQAQAEDPRCDLIEAFFQNPTHEHNWTDWFREVIEEMYVTDAVTLYPRVALDGKSLVALELMDGATIKRLISEDGRTPRPPEPAYQQILKGLPAVDYTTDELLYRPRNRRVWKLYGFSHVERFVVTVLIALNRQASVMDHFSAGTIPDAIYSFKQSVTAENIKTFQNSFDSMMAGNLEKRRQIRFLPDGSMTLLKDPELKSPFDEWLARIACFVFGVPPTPFIAQVNRATAETAHVASKEEGIAPPQLWWKQTADFIIGKLLGASDLEWQWDVEESTDPMVQAEIDKIYVESGVLTPNEIREELGYEDKDGGDELRPAGGAGGGPGGGADGIELARANLRKAKGPKHLPRERATIKRARRKMATALAAHFKRQAAAVAKHLGDALQLKKAAKDKDQVVDSVTLDDVGDLVEPYLADIAKEGSRMAILQVGEGGAASFDLANVRAEDWAARRAGDLYKQYRDVTMTKLRGIVSDAIEEGMSVDALKDALTDSYAFSPERASVIARTELARADVAGNLIGWKQSGVVTGKRWITAGDDKVSEACVENESRGAIALEDSFVDDDDQELDGPPAHPNCRCDIAPVVEDDGASEKSVTQLVLDLAKRVAPSIRVEVPAPVVHVNVERQAAPIVHVNLPARGPVEKVVVERDERHLAKRIIERPLKE